MDTVFIILIFAAVATGIGVAIATARRKKREAAEREAEETRREMLRQQKKANVEVMNLRASQTYRGGQIQRRPYVPATTASNVQPSQSSGGIDPLMAGLVGYMIGNSGTAHAVTAPTPQAFHGNDGESGGAGATGSFQCTPEERTSSYDGGSSSDSSSSYSSSDSGSSSSSDSGGSSGGGSSD